MAAHYISSVPKLLGRENYDDWAFAVENFLVLDGLSKCIDGTETNEEKMAKAKAKVVLTLDSSIFVHIREAKTVQDLWNTLKDMYDDKGFTRKIGLLRNLISLRLDNCDSMQAYINQVIETSQKLRRTGFKIDDEWIGSLLLAGLPEKFSPMIMAIEHSGISIKADAIKTKLLDMQIEGDTRKSGGAFVSKAGFKKPRGGNVTTNVRKDIVCYRCKKTGHFMNKCPEILSSKNSQQNNQKRFNPGGSNAFSAVFLSGEFNNTDWYVDSGASIHLTAKDDWLMNVKKEPGLKEIMVANKTKIPVVCEGDIEINTIIDTERHNIVINNVLYVPDLTTNLLSVSQLIKNGNKVIFNEKGCEIYNGYGKLVAKANLLDNVYRLVFEKPEQSLLAAVAVPGEVWHRRFGHLNYKALRLMNNGAVNGLDCKGKFNNTNACVICCEGKQTRLSFKHEGSRAKELLGIVHADLCGPMEVTSLGGSKYFLLFEDDFSRMTFVYFLKSKDEAFDSFKDFKSFVENQKGTKIKVLRTDNGGEFCSTVFQNFLVKNGIVHQKTNPYTPEQNGMLERMNRTIVEKARCLLFDAEFDKSFWAEAVSTAVYLRNRSVVTGLDNKTPLEAWSNKKPDVSNLRIFGSKVMVHTPKQKRSKWDKKAKEMFLVGFSDHVKGYRLYDPITKKVITSRDVVFFENTTSRLPVVLDDSQENAERLSVSVGDKNQHDDEVSNDTDSFEASTSSDSEYVMPYKIPEVVRRSERQRTPRSYNDYVTYMCTDETSDETNLEAMPVTVSEALSRPDGNKWRQAMMDELDSFEESDAWDLMDLPEKGTIVENKWVFKVKCDSDNQCSYRARLVAKGFTQKEGIDYGETFAPVVRHSTLRLLVGLAVKLDLEITHLDVKTAFLNGLLEEDVYMRQPEGFVLKGFENKVCKLKKAIYGLKQSSRAWNTKVDQTLIKLGYKKSELEPCLYTRKKDNLYTIVALYVDDFFIFYNDKENLTKLKQCLSAEFKIKDLGSAKQCLGVRIMHDKRKGIITMDQESYINQVLQRFNMTDCKSVSTPMDSNICFDDSDNNSDLCDKTIPYQRLIGSLMYLAVLTRPDIAYTVSFLSQYNNCYTDLHWKCAKRVLRYLAGTRSCVLSFSKDGCELEGYVDADWAGNVKDRKSYTGFVFKLAGAAISWESNKQKTVALSSTEAEYMALSEASKEAIYLKNLLYELIGYTCSVTVFNDNQSAQKLSSNPVLHKRSKHIDVRHHFVREAVLNGLVDIKYLSTANMIADVLTKSLASSKHSNFVKGLGLINF